MTPIAPPRVAHAIGLIALANFGLLFWMGMVEPWQAGHALAALGVTAAAFLAPRRALPLVAVAALIAGGVAPSDLWPAQWGQVAGSIGDGLDSVFGARIPYEGTDPDLLLVIPLGGALLAALAGVLARRHRLLGLLTLIVLFAVPAVAMRTGVAAGAGMALLVVLYLTSDRLTHPELKRASIVAGGACLLAMAVAPALDRDRPWFDYEEFTQSTAATRTTEFNWDHDYARLPWSRDGREMIRVASPRRAYWRTDGLELFDGYRWAEDPTHAEPPATNAQDVGIDPDNLQRWSFPIEVSVRNLKSRTLPLAGVTSEVAMAGRTPTLIGPGVWTAGRPIRRGDAYRARVYVPEPSRRQLETAPSGFPVSIFDDVSFQALAGNGRDPLEFVTRRFRSTPLRVGTAMVPGADDLRHSNIGRIYGLSQRLLRGSRSPYDYVRAVQRHLGSGFVYDETPPRAAQTLDGFLFDAKSGFCQQYSGAMALLLRMGGVPARVATGFAPGSLDERADRYVVRDFDAHSWVEAWFSGIGWVVFDPTPAAAPPRSQASSSEASAGNGDVRDRGTAQVAPPSTVPDEPFPWPPLLAGVVALVLLATIARVLSTRERPAPLPELERALRGAGETVPPGTTLTTLEAQLPGATAYLTALRAQRYGTGAGPTPADRRALRRTLSEGRSLTARARTWRALRHRT